MENGEKNNPEESAGKLKVGFWVPLANPIVLITLLILGSVCLQIGFALAGWDHGVVANFGHAEYARGFITYLFAMVTIGTSVVLVVSALTGEDDTVHQRRFDRGKEILSLLLGVFGTIVGFYFGQSSQAAGSSLQMASLRVAHTGSGTDSKYAVTTFVSGGKPTYQFAVTVGDGHQSTFESVPENGWITKELDGKQFVSGATQVAIDVKDSDGHTSRQVATVVNQP